MLQKNVDEHFDQSNIYSFFQTKLHLSPLHLHLHEAILVAVCPIGIEATPRKDCVLFIL